MTEPNGFTTLIAILILALIILTVRYILKNGSHQNSAGCTGNCTSCGIGCMSSYSPEKKQLDAVLEERKSIETLREELRRKKQNQAE